MKIPIVPFGKRPVQLVVQRRYRTSRPLIPLGCDCHPAHMLNELSLRRTSYPFDWLATRPAVGLTYVNSNIKLKFERFLEDLARNKRGHVFAGPYRSTEFIHYGDLMENTDTRAMLMRRACRFLELFGGRSCDFLYVITSRGLGSADDVRNFVDSVEEFHRLSRGRHTLRVCIRYDESESENAQQCEQVASALKALDSTRVIRYVRHLKKYGRWGDEREYVPLLTRLGVKLQPWIPRVNLSVVR